MQSIITKVAMQAALAGGVGMGTQVFKKMFKRKNTEIIENTLFLKHNSTLCEALNGIYLLKRDDEFNILVHEIENILREMNNPSTKASQWVINRKMYNVINYINKMLENSKSSKDDSVIIAYLDTQSDHLPLIESQFEMLMHNFLLEIK